MGICGVSGESVQNKLKNAMAKSCAGELAE